MKKRPQTILKHLPPVKLYLDDLRDIHQVLIDNCESVEIRTREYEISDITQLKNIGLERVNELWIEAHSPFISLDFLKYEARIYVSEASIVSLGILNQIETILQRCVRKFARIFNFWVVFICGGVIVVALFRTIQLFEGTLPIVISVSTLLLIAIAYILWYRLTIYRYSTVVLSERKESKSFFKRNKDRLLVNLIVAIIAALLTLLLTKLFS